MSRNKVMLYIAKPAEGIEGATRLIRGSLKQVESLLRAEVEIEPATPEQTHAMADVAIEDATGEP